MSEHSCSSPGARHLAGLCSSHRALSGAGRRHCVHGQRWKGHGGDENREQEEGTVSFYKASNGTKPTLATQVWPPSHEGFIKTCMSECSLELCMSISLEAKFIINRVSREDYRIPIVSQNHLNEFLPFPIHTHPPIYTNTQAKSQIH